jgi:acetyl esterase/lipase
MPIDPRAKRLLDMMAMQGDARCAMTVERRRDGFARLMQMGAKPIVLPRVENRSIAGPAGVLPMRIYDAVATRGSPAPALIFFHGGGLVAGSIDTHDTICRHLAAASEAVVISVGYRLAPEAPYPAALDDAAHAVSDLGRTAKHYGIDLHRIAIGAESAGCLLATALAQGLCASPAQFRAQLLLCPVVDLSGRYPSREEYGSGYLIDASTVAHDIAQCFPDAEHNALLPSPLRFGSAAAAPPTIIVSAECDPFRDEAQLYGEMLEDAGVPVWHRQHAGMVHSFYGLPALLPQAAPALAEAGLKLRELVN